MRTVFITILLFQCIGNLDAQHFELLKGKNHLDDRHILFAALHDKEIVLLLSEYEGLVLQYDTDLYIEKLDNSFSTQYSKRKNRRAKNLLPGIISDKTTIYHFGNINGNFYLYYSKRNIDRNGVELCVMAIDPDFPEQSSEVVLETIKMKESNNSISFHINKEKSLVSFSYNKEDANSDNCILTASVFQTQTHEQKWSEEFRSEKKKKQFRFYDEALSEEGIFAVGLKSYRKTNGKEYYVNQLGDESRAYDMGLILFKEGKAEYVELKSYQNYVREYDFRIRNNTLIACGTYQRYYGGNITGIFCVEIDLNSKKVLSNRWIPFSNALLKKLKKEDVAEIKRIDSGIKVKSGTGKIAFAQNDRLYYIFEPAKFARFGAGYSSPDYFYARSIIVTEILDESLHYLIPRFNQSDLTSGNSTKIIESEEQLYILYLDHRDNIDKKEKLKKSKTFETKVLASAVIDEKNNISREVLLDLKKEGFICIPPGILNLSDESFLIDGQSYDYRGFNNTYPQRNGILKIK